MSANVKKYLENLHDIISSGGWTEDDTFDIAMDVVIDAMIDAGITSSTAKKLKDYYDEEWFSKELAPIHKKITSIAYRFGVEEPDLDEKPVNTKKFDSAFKDLISKEYPKMVAKYKKIGTDKIKEIIKEINKRSSNGVQEIRRIAKELRSK